MGARTHADFVVVGAGIGGLGVALALAQTGAEVLVLERASEVAEIGAGIQLGPNALRVLDRLDVLKSVSRDAVEPPAATMRDARTGDILARLAFDHTFRNRFGFTYFVTHRTDLHRCLLDAAEATERVKWRYRSTVAQVVQDPGRHVTVTLVDGHTIDARALVGADGLHSVVRKHVAGESRLQYLGDYAYRGTVPYETFAQRDGKDDVTWWVGERMHLMQYPVRSKGLYNQVAVFNTSRRGGAVDGWDHEAEFRARFDGLHRIVVEGAHRLDKARVWPVADREPLRQWTRGRATLLGDAAHPMVQYLAQGACQALEDGVALARCVDAERDVEAAFSRYEAERMPVTTKVQNWARTMGEVVHAGGIAAELRNELFRSRHIADAPQLAWLYGDRNVNETAGQGVFNASS